MARSSLTYIPGFSTLDKVLQGTFLPSMVPIHPVVLEKKFVLHISHRVAMLNYVPRWWPSWIQTSSQEPLDGLEPYLAEMFLARPYQVLLLFVSTALHSRWLLLLKMKNYTEKPGIYVKLLLAM
jgi:hypothetical protein